MTNKDDDDDAQILVNFHVGYYDEQGNLVDDLAAARRHYVTRGQFFLDMMSIIPVELVPALMPLDYGAHHLVHKLTLIHLIRVVHVKRFFKRLQTNINIK